MAIYILAASTDRPLGSRSGATFQRAGVNFVIRKRTVPVQKRTPSQSIVKNRFDHVQKNWTTLTAPEKQTFSDEAINYPRTDSLGNPYTLRGDSLQSSTNLNLLSTGSPPVDSIPAPVIFPAWTVNSAQIFFSTTDGIFSTSINPIPAGFAVTFLISRPYPKQELQPNLPRWQVAQYTAGENQTLFNWYNRFVELFGNAPELVGQYFHCHVRYISLDTGQEDTPIDTIGLITL